MVKMLFEKAHLTRPSIIFIDEIDSLVSSRSDGDNNSTQRIKTQFLAQMDGVGTCTEGVFVLAATNLPWILGEIQ